MQPYLAKFTVEGFIIWAKYYEQETQDYLFVRKFDQCSFVQDTNEIILQSWYPQYHLFIDKESGEVTEQYVSAAPGGGS